MITIPSKVGFYLDLYQKLSRKKTSLVGLGPQCRHHYQILNFRSSHFLPSVSWIIFSDPFPLKLFIFYTLVLMATLLAKIFFSLFLCCSSLFLFPSFIFNLKAVFGPYPMVVRGLTWQCSGNQKQCQGLELGPATSMKSAFTLLLSSPLLPLDSPSYHLSFSVALHICMSVPPNSEFVCLLGYACD